MRGVVQEVEPMDENAIRNAIRRFLEQPPAPAVCRASVEPFTWDAVAEQIQQCYEEVLTAYGEKAQKTSAV